jgi:endonuclease YncB( thermonuclease family)
MIAFLRRAGARRGALAISILFLLGIGLVVARDPDTRRVVRVVDGDTVRLKDGETIRLLGIDTPERHEPLYVEASKRLSSLVEERDVALEFDHNRRDHYKRLLGYLWVGDTLVNEAMVESGLARVYMWPPDTLHRARLVAAQKRSRSRHLGVWSLAAPRAEPYYVIHQERMRFHRPGCSSVRGKADPTATDRDSLLDLGFSACRSCRP